MGVRTTADERLDEARTHLREARRILLSLIGDEPWGWDDYSDEYKEKVWQATKETKEFADRI